MLRNCLKRIKNWMTANPGRRLESARPTPRPRRAPLSLEPLEDRFAPAQLTVASALDPANLTPGTLRYAVSQANTDAARGVSDTIVFSTAQMGGSRIVLQQGMLELQGGSGTTTIDGAGKVVIDGGGASGDFQVDSGAHAVLTGLTLQGGNDIGGGAVANYSTLTLRNATLTGNTAEYGGAIYNGAGATLIITNATLAGNTASAGGNGEAGGILNDGGTLTLNDCTVAANTADFRCGIANDGGTLTLFNTIVAGNSATRSQPDVGGDVTGGSAHNLIGDGDGTSGVSDGDANGNRVGTDGNPIDPLLALRT